MTNATPIDEPTPATSNEAAGFDASAGAEAAGPVETSTEVEVGLVRSVRYGRLLVIGAALGAVIAGLLALAFPVAPDARYELGQAVGFSIVIGAAAGLMLGGLLALGLGLAAKRNRGGARAVQIDVQ